MPVSRLDRHPCRPPRPRAVFDGDVPKTDRDDRENEDGDGHQNHRRLGREPQAGDVDDEEADTRAGRVRGPAGRSPGRERVEAERQVCEREPHHVESQIPDSVSLDEAEQHVVRDRRELAAVHARSQHRQVVHDLDDRGETGQAHGEDRSDRSHLVPSDGHHCGHRQERERVE